MVLLMLHPSGPFFALVLQTALAALPLGFAVLMFLPHTPHFAIPVNRKWVGVDIRVRSLDFKVCWIE